MDKVLQERHVAEKKRDGKNLLMRTKQAYINKEKGELQHKVWKPRRMKKTVDQQQS